MSDRESAARLFRNARREARLTLILWALALLWSLGYCYLRGYEHAPDSWVVQNGWAEPRTAENFGQLWGFPDWVLLGIILPWLICSAFTAGFCLGMTDDELGREKEEGERHGH